MNTANIRVPFGDGSLRYVEPEIRAGIYGTPSPGDVVLDCGAYVGLFTQYALEAGAKLVIAVEPDPETFKCLTENLSEETIAGRVVAFNVALWRYKGTATLHTNDHYHSANSIVLARRRPRCTVNVDTIDAIMGHLDLNQLDFIKMDIEGAEVPALHGGAETIRKFRPRMGIAAEHFGDDHVKIPAVIREICPEYKISLGSDTLICEVPKEITT